MLSGSLPPDVQNELISLFVLLIRVNPAAASFELTLSVICIALLGVHVLGFPVGALPLRCVAKLVRLVGAVKKGRVRCFLLSVGVIALSPLSWIKVLGRLTGRDDVNTLASDRVVLCVITTRGLCGMTIRLLDRPSRLWNMWISAGPQVSALFLKTIGGLTLTFRVRLLTARWVIVRSVESVRLAAGTFLPSSGRTLAPVHML